MTIGRLAPALALALAACAGPPPAPVDGPPSGVPAQPPAVAAPPPAPGSDAAPPADDPTRAAEAEVRRMLATVARARGLPVKRDVPGRVLDRAGILARIREHVAREIPPDVLTYQGESLAALELIPADYDFLAGTYRLLQGRIAGFYEPADGTMYLVDDLDEAEANETLAHELVHALQDQSYDLGKLLAYRAGDSDRLAAVHSLIEGDATSAMLDVVAGTAFAIDEAMLRKLVAISTAMSTVGDTPRALQESLSVPYTDGFGFVQRLRKAGGWPRVDAIWRALPESTEQLLHPEKLASREPPIAVPAPPVDALGPDFKAVFDDVMGEQGLRIAFADYAHRELATAAAAGWGGDRFVVARRAHPMTPGLAEYGLAWRLRFDTAADAKEAAKVFEARFGRGCKVRPAMGPVSWAQQGADVALVAGPWERAVAAGGGKAAAGGGKAAAQVSEEGDVPEGALQPAPPARSTGTCAQSKGWLKAVLGMKIGG